jgi:hypothetical protein
VTTTPNPAPLSSTLGITMTSSKLLEDFKYLRGHCIDLVHAYFTYTRLFNDKNRDLLTKVAPTFFSDIADIMLRDWLLQVCKLMDPPSTTRKGVTIENITIKLINEQLTDNKLLSLEIEDLANKLLIYGEKIKPARDKRLAHFDRDHQVNGLVLGATTESELDQFLVNLQKYCDEVGIAIGLGPLDFGRGGCKGDVLDFLKYLRKMQNA